MSIEGMPARYIRIPDRMIGSSSTISSRINQLSSVHGSESGRYADPHFETTAVRSLHLQRLAVGKHPFEPLARRSEADTQLQLRELRGGTGAIVTDTKHQIGCFHPC